MIHDAAVFRRPEHFRRAYAFFHRLQGRILALRANLATVSDFSLGELAAVLNRPAETIAVVPNGADHLGRVRPDHRVLEALDLTRRPYFVALGNRAPNKNLTVLIRALARLPDPETRLVLIGEEAGIFTPPAPPTDPRLILAGRRSDAEIAALLRGARALVLPSLYEGFGIPPLEAMAEDCPVIASDIPAVHEVCADAALYFAPPPTTRPWPDTWPPCSTSPPIPPAWPSPAPASPTTAGTPRPRLWKPGWTGPRRRTPMGVDDRGFGPDRNNRPPQPPNIAPQHQPRIELVHARRTTTSFRI